MLAATKKNTAERGADLAGRQTSASRSRERCSRTTPGVGESSSVVDIQAGS